ncbi:hypothetical protein VP01_2620g2 [Puccinia sorghi]|uniref:Uncharacterized protein n=1 Tax=Puccinia sorghi TaxID=27349 RepID=A0A0L6V536_9BASI|nr:hypothetical protein VP01_2620g2 [Puccinia sorghi]
MMEKHRHCQIAPGKRGLDSGRQSNKQFNCMSPGIVQDFFWLSGLTFAFVSRNEQTFVSGGDIAGRVGGWFWEFEQASEEYWADRGCSGGCCRGKPDQRSARGFGGWAAGGLIRSKADAGTKSGRCCREWELGVWELNGSGSGSGSGGERGEVVIGGSPGVFGINLSIHPLTNKSEEKGKILFPCCSVQRVLTREFLLLGLKKNTHQSRSLPHYLLIWFFFQHIGGLIGNSSSCFIVGRLKVQKIFFILLHLSSFFKTNSGTLGKVMLPLATSKFGVVPPPKSKVGYGVPDQHMVDALEEILRAKSTPTGAKIRPWDYPRGLFQCGGGGPIP